MERRGNGKINFCELARSLGISSMTIYRVLNNVPCVRLETRAKVIDALNRHGYYTHTPCKNIKVLFDFTEHPYLSYYGRVLMNNISKLNYTCFSTDHRKKPKAFFDIAGECDVAVFVSIPEPETINLARKANPDIYTITLSTQSNADVTLSPNNTRGGELAAEHFHRQGHRHIAVHMCERHPTRQERWSGFFARMKMLDPDCRIDIIRETVLEKTATVLHNYFANTDSIPTGIFFLAGEFAENYLMDFLPEAPPALQDLSVMTFDHPADLEFKRLHYDFDRIEFDSRNLIFWAEYYITNRPMMKKRSPIHSSIDVRLVLTGSVKKINQENNNE